MLLSGIHLGESGMFRPLKNVNNESGIVLFIVLMTVIIIMIISYSILSQSMNEVNFAQQQIDEIQTQELAEGYFWQNYYGATPGVGASQTGSGRTYVLNSWTNTAPVSYITPYTIITNYDTFN